MRFANSRHLFLYCRQDIHVGVLPIDEKSQIQALDRTQPGLPLKPGKCGTPPMVKERLANHPRWVFHFTPTPAPWINAVENFFSVITRRRLKQGVFKSVPDLHDAILRYIKEHNRYPKPFVWTKPAQSILAAVQRRPEPSACVATLP